MYPERRNLDGVYFRVLRDGHWTNVCFTDMLESEKSTVLAGKSAEWCKNLALVLASQLRYIGDLYDLMKE